MVNRTWVRREETDPDFENHQPPIFGIRVGLSPHLS